MRGKLFLLSSRQSLASAGMPEFPDPKLQQMAAFHSGQAAYHDLCAAGHQALGETEAAARHREAAKAHTVAAAAPMDPKLGGAAMRAGGIADAASQQVVRERR